MPQNMFDVLFWRVTCSYDFRDGAPVLANDATVKVSVDGVQNHVAETGVGPVDALAGALKKALLQPYPVIRGLSVDRYDVHIRNGEKGTAAEVEVSMVVKLGEEMLVVKKTSENILRASFEALAEGAESLLRACAKKGGRE